MLNNAEGDPVEAQIEENVRRSTRQRGSPPKLQDFEWFQDNEINDDGAFIHFANMVESESAKTNEALSDLIC